MSLESALDRIVRPSAVITFVSAVVWLMLASGEMGEGWTHVWNPATWHAVLFDTAFGHAWQIHLFLAAALLALSQQTQPKASASATDAAEIRCARPGCHGVLSTASLSHYGHARDVERLSTRHRSKSEDQGDLA